MRVLIASTGNDGHFGPLLPFARACVVAGHEVRVAAPASYAAAVQRAGLVPEPFSDAPPDLIGPVMSRLPSMSFQEADATVVGEVFAKIDARAALPGLTHTVGVWRPDLVLREPAEFGSLAAAERGGVPHVRVAIGMQETTRTLLALADKSLDELASFAGLPEGQLHAAWSTEPTLSTVHEHLDRAGDAGYDEEAVTVRVSTCEPAAAPDDPLPRWGEPNLPLLYVTFGSVTGSMPWFAGLFREAVDALADQPVRVFMTVGRRFDLGGLGPLPANAYVAPWWPQADVFTVASAVLSHGGFGTTMGALAAGLPQLVAPIFSSDQVVNGRHLAAAGVGRTIEPGPDLIPRALTVLTSLFNDPSYTAAARTSAEDLSALPDVSRSVGFLESLGL